MTGNRYMMISETGIIGGNRATYHKIFIRNLMDLRFHMTSRAYYAISMND